jgi:Aldehyde dehydrogenase family
MEGAAKAVMGSQPQQDGRPSGSGRTPIPRMHPWSPAHAPAAPPPTSRRAMDESVSRLREGAGRFARLSLEDRIRLARAMRAGYARVAARTVDASCRAKRIGTGTQAEGDEWSLGPWPVLRQFRLIIEALTFMRRLREPPIGDVDRTVDGRLRIEIFPGSPLDSVLLSGLRAEVHARAGISEREMRSSRVRFYRQSSPAGRVDLILGGGTVAGIACQDVLTKMFNEGAVCLLKLHPLNAFLGPLLEEAFADAIARDFLRVVYGGADEGGYLAEHPGIDNIHLTGSAATYERLLWGRNAGRPPGYSGHLLPYLSKPITAGLGNVSPVLIVPGPYLDRQLAFQAEAVAGAFAHNAAYTCCTPRLLVCPRGWAQRGTFLRYLEAALSRVPHRFAFYPGAIERWEELIRDRPNVRVSGSPAAGVLPWTLVPGLEASDRREPLFAAESFCPILGETEVGSTDPLEYLQQAVGFVNERVWGNLCATLIVHPKILGDRHQGSAVERAITQLRYGTVGVNTWPGLGFALSVAPWGAHPSSSMRDIQSGRGWVHNTAMLEEVEKTVLRHPITTQLKPGYAAGHRTAHLLFRRLSAVERGQGWAGLPGVLDAARRA